MSRAAVTLKEYKAESRPEFKWIVFWPSPEPGSPRKRKRFKTRTAANQFVTKKEAEILNSGAVGASLKSAAVAEAVWALKQLAPYNVSLRDVVTDYVARRSAADKSARVTEAVSEILEAKGRDGLSAVYIKDLRQRLSRFSGTFGDRLLSEVTTREISNWLRGLKLGPTSRNNFRRNLSVFFSWARAMGYCASNPVEAAPKAKVPKDAPVEIFTPGEVRVILDHAPAGLVPVLALGAFAGLRLAEICRIDWAEIDLVGGHVEVTAAKAKTASRRLVPISDALRAWLTPHAETSGPVAPVNPTAKLGDYHRELEKPVRKKGQGRPAVHWKQNGLRHSFASYAVADEEDAAKVALWLGHSTTKMIFSNYRERVSKGQAEEYFGIRPGRSNRITSIAS